MSPPQQLDQPPRKTTLLTDRVELPTTFFNRCLYVDLKINGMGPYRFVVDTGASSMSITPQVAREARISFSKKYTGKVMGSSGQYENQYVVTIDRIEADLFALNGVSAFIEGPRTLFSSIDQGNGGRSYGGIIGMGPFRNVLLELDYPQRKVVVIRPDSESLPAEKGVPYTEIRPHVTIATPSAKYGTTTAVIDTGAESGFDLTGIESYPVRVGLVKKDGYFFGVGGYVRTRYGQLSGDIRLGPATWRDPIICEANENRIGSDALAPWKLVIDQEKKRLWLLDDEKITVTRWIGPLEPDGRPAVYGFAFLPEGDSLVVTEVDPGSRAERAGLKPGDRFHWESDEPHSPGQKPGEDPSRIRMQIVRGSEKLEVTLSITGFPSDHPEAGGNGSMGAPRDR